MTVRSTLLRQIYPLYIAVVVLSLVLLIAYASAGFNASYYEQMEKKIDEDAVFLRNIFPREYLKDPDRAQDFVARASAGRSTRITVILPDGIVIADSARHPAELESHGERPEFLRAMKGGRGSSRRRSGSVAEELLYIAVPLYEGTEVSAVVRAAGVLQEPRDKLRELYAGIAAAGAVILLITGAAGYMITRRINEPLRTIHQAAEKFARGELDTRISVSRPEEARVLAATLNLMAGQLQSRIEAVTRRRNEVESILAGMMESVIFLDTDRRIKMMNRAAERLLRKTLGECAGKSLLDISRATEMESLGREIMLGRGPVDKTLSLHDEGRVMHLQAHGTLLRGPAGDPEGILLVLNDITRMNQLEAIRRDFVANVSHELKTPITSIQGFVETLSDGAIDDPSRARPYLKIIETQSKRLNSIIEDLLSLSRLESPDTDIRMEETEIDAVLDTVFDVYLPRAHAGGIDLKRKGTGGLRVRVNPLLIEQAVANLVDNAVRYSGSGATVAVSAVREENGISIAVEDTGPGIPAADLPRIFERFYRVDKARSRASGGTGLGLAIVKHIALAHGGIVQAESETGRGSRFVIRLPGPPV